MTERLVAAVIVAAVAAEVLYVVDVATGGTVSRAARRARGEVERRAAMLREEQEIQRQARWVIFEATEAAREGAGS